MGSGKKKKKKKKKTTPKLCFSSLVGALFEPLFDLLLSISLLPDTWGFGLAERSRGESVKERFEGQRLEVLLSFLRASGLFLSFFLSLSFFFFFFELRAKL